MALFRKGFLFCFTLTIVYPFVNSNQEVVVDESSNMSEKVNKGQLNVALCQIAVSYKKSLNIENSKQSIIQAVEDGAEMVVLPECWNSPYDTTLFRQYAETVDDGPSILMIKQTAIELGVWIVGGTIPELDIKTGKIYNTCVVVNAQGKVVTIHRKMHLFDIDVVGKITFKESDTLSAGNQITTFESPFGVVGVGICYDLRFPELSLLMRQRGASMLIFPSAFNVVTGKSHWEILARARAVDTQTFVLMASPARNAQGYQAWGHSMVVDPWGVVLGEAKEEPEIVHATLEFDRTIEVRRSVPVSLQRRPDVYQLSEM